MPGLLHLPAEVLTLIVEEVCITAELDNLGQTVAVELECPPGDGAVGEGSCQRDHPPLLGGDDDSALGGGGAQIVRYAGSRPDKRHQRDQLEALILRRFRGQALGRVVAGSFLGGAHHGSHAALESFFQDDQAEVNHQILGHTPGVGALLALASTCRLLRACAEPFLYRAADLGYGNPCAYAEHLGLLLKYPHLASNVRMLSFSTKDDVVFEHDKYGFQHLDPRLLSEAVACLVSREGLVSREEVWRQLGPDNFGSHVLHPSMFRAVFLFLLPEVRSLKIDLAPAHAGHAPHPLWLFCALLQEPNDVWAAAKVPALRKLEEFSLLLDGRPFDASLLLPFLLLPKIRTFYASALNTMPLIMDQSEKSQLSGKSAITEMIFDFLTIDGITMDSLLRLPGALEKLTLNFNSPLPPEETDEPRLYAPSRLVDALRTQWASLRHQRHSMRRLTIRQAARFFDMSLPSLKEFSVLEHLTISLAMLLLHDRNRPRRCLADCLPASVERLELLAYNHVPVRTWQLEVLSLLNDKQAATPRLRQVFIEHWVPVPDGPVSKYDLEVEAVVSLGRQVGIEVVVDFVEYKPAVSLYQDDSDWSSSD